MTVLEVIRRQRGLSQKQVAQAVGLHPSVVSQVERRYVRAYPRARRKLCEFFGLTEAELFDKEGAAKRWEGEGLKLA